MIVDPKIISLPNVSLFNTALVKFTHPNYTPAYGIHARLGFLLFTRLRVGFSHLREHKFRHNCTDINNPFCFCRTNAVETTEHYLLYCRYFCLCRNDNLRHNELTLLPTTVVI